MIDIKRELAGLLEDIAPVELSFSDFENSVPLICISEMGNSSELVLCGEDRVSRITFQLDLFGGTAEATEAMAVLVNKRLTERGMKRSFSALVTGEKRIRKAMRYTFGIDEATGRILSLK